MTEYVICCFGDMDAKPPKEIKGATINEINLLKGKKSFSELAKESTGENEKVKFYIASRDNFYHIFDALIEAGVPYGQLVKPEPLIKAVSILGTDYPMREEFLTNPSKPIDRAIAKENLLLLKSILEHESFNFFLVYGTLLGAVREGDFIAHDSDIDIGMYYTEKERFLPFVFKLKEVGLELVRFDSHLLSLMRNGEYIDIYFFEKKLLPRPGWHCEGLYMPTKFLETLDTIDFHQSQFLAPKNHLDLLVYLYGKNWKTPVKNKHAKPLFSLKSYILQLLPLSLKSFIKRYLNK